MLSNLNSLARGLALVLAVAALAGCATSKEKLLTHGDRTMMDIWQPEAGDGGGARALAREHPIGGQPPPRPLREELPDGHVRRSELGVGPSPDLGVAVLERGV